MKINEYINFIYNVFFGYFGLMGIMKKIRYFFDILKLYGK